MASRSGTPRRAASPASVTYAQNIGGLRGRRDTRPLSAKLSLFSHNFLEKIGLIIYCLPCHFMLEPPLQNSFSSTAIVIIGGSRISRGGGFNLSKPGCWPVGRYSRHCFLAARHAAGLLRRDVADHRDAQQVQHRDAVGESDHLRNVIRVS